MAKVFKVTKSFCGIPVGKRLDNVNAENQAELIEQGLIKEVDANYKEKVEKPKEEQIEQETEEKTEN